MCELRINDSWPLIITDDRKLRRVSSALASSGLVSRIAVVQISSIESNKHATSWGRPLVISSTTAHAPRPSAIKTRMNRSNCRLNMRHSGSLLVGWTCLKNTAAVLTRVRASIGSRPSIPSRGSAFSRIRRQPRGIFNSTPIFRKRSNSVRTVYSSSGYTEVAKVGVNVFSALLFAASSRRTPAKYCTAAHAKAGPMMSKYAMFRVASLTSVESCCLKCEREGRQTAVC